MWGNICLLGTLTIFGYLHLICIARNATRLLLLLLLLRPPTTTPTPLGMTTTTTTPLSTLCTALCIRVVFQMTGALRCAAQSIFGMSLPITPFQYLRRILSTFLFCFVPPPFLSPSLSLSLALSHAVAETTNQPGKTATIEMYAPSSYNDTVTGETLSSVSEKSESYSNEGSQPEYIVSIHTHKHTHIHWGTNVYLGFLVPLPRFGFLSRSFFSLALHEYAISDNGQKCRLML